MGATSTRGGRYEPGFERGSDVVHVLLRVVCQINTAHDTRHDTTHTARAQFVLRPTLTPPNGRAQANDVGAGSIGAGGAGRGNRGGWYDGDDDDDASGDGARRGDVDGAPAGA
jgi:hypothetical protein